MTDDVQLSLQPQRDVENGDWYVRMDLSCGSC